MFVLLSNKYVAAIGLRIDKDMTATISELIVRTTRNASNLQVDTEDLTKSILVNRKSVFILQQTRTSGVK
jgi:hypothetical protein